jgi:CheY-like chemotaxis protein
MYFRAYFQTLEFQPRHRLVWRKLLIKIGFPEFISHYHKHGTPIAYKGVRRKLTQRGKNMNEKANILIVDDEEVVRLSHLRSLEGTDCNAQAAGDGQEALTIMEQHPADVVLLDLRMPDLDGMSVLKTIKERWPDSEVVVITGYPSLESAKQAVQLGAFNYLAKPLGPADVLKAANDAVNQKRWGIRSDNEHDISVH